MFASVEKLKENYEKYVKRYPTIVEHLRMQLADNACIITLQDKNDSKKIGLTLDYVGVYENSSRECEITLIGYQGNNQTIHFDQISEGEIGDILNAIDKVYSSALEGRLTIELWRIYPYFRNVEFVGMKNKDASESEVVFIRPGWFTRKFGKRISVKEFKPYISDM